MVMELLIGKSLADALRDGPLSIPMAAEIASAILSALDAAHRAGFVHRDIKPGNIFLAERPAGAIAVKVLDFGIAKLVKNDTPSLTQSGVVVGTPLYMAPEQVLAEKEVDGRADVWAVGATLFEMLTGRPVHLAPNATAAAVKVVTETAPRVRTLRPDVDGALDGLVARALAVDRANRFATAGEMQAALDACRVSLAPTQAADSGLAPSVKTVVESAVKARRMRSRLVLLGGVSLVLGVFVGGMLFARTKNRTVGSSAPIVAETVATASTTDPPRTTATPPPVETSPLPTATASATTTATATATGTTSATATASATVVRTASPNATGAPKHPPAVTCGSGEHVSKGHCCSIGLEWQADHCDRPLATEVPF
jgi:serine/threonine-protein kinase